MYLTGLGAVEGMVPTGASTPFGSLFPIRGHFTCRFSPYTQDAATLFAGLAPGLTGIYQVTFQMARSAQSRKAQRRSVLI
jgi:uncharacterized protein (TIGR03437 family)